MTGNIQKGAGSVNVRHFAGRTPNAVAGGSGTTRTVQIKMWGAGGGASGSTSEGGGGAYASLTLSLVTGDSLGGDVGMGGEHTSTYPGGPGWPGGGCGGLGQTNAGAGGGGYSSCYVISSSLGLDAEQLIAGGGGGGCYAAKGGAGGGTGTAQDGTIRAGTDTNGKGGTQSAAGAGGAASGASPGWAGNRRNGGRAGDCPTTTNEAGGGGGGGGYWGGGGGSGSSAGTATGGGGGGSSYRASTEYTLTIGSYKTPGNDGDSDRPTNAGNGATAYGTGVAGAVVIIEDGIVVDTFTTGGAWSYSVS